MFLSTLSNAVVSYSHPELSRKAHTTSTEYFRIRATNEFEWNSNQSAGVREGTSAVYISGFGQGKTLVISRVGVGS